MAGVGASAAVAVCVRQDVVRLSHQGLPAVELLGRVLARVRQVVPFDASFWSTTDPATLLVTGGLVQDLPLAACQPYFDHELLVPDVNKFAELARRPRPVGVLSQATGGDLRQSARYRFAEDLFGPFDELRVAFVADGWCWGVAALVRLQGTFAAREANFVADLAGHLAHGLRTALLDPAAKGGHGAPGTVVVDARGQVEAVTPEAERWMAELTALTHRTGYLDQPATPPVVYVVAARARAALAGRDQGPPRPGAHPCRPVAAGARLAPVGLGRPRRAGRGGDRTGPPGPDRPGDCCRLPADQAGAGRGVPGPGNRADRPGAVPVPHTVRGYLKDLFAKVGVASRGELVARLFADHYHDQPAGTVTVTLDPA